MSNDVAAELATVGDGVLEALRDRLRCTILLRGNRLTIEGSDPDVAQARAGAQAVAQRAARIGIGLDELGPVLARSAARADPPYASKSDPGARERFSRLWVQER